MYCCLVSSSPAPEALAAIARACSPRVELHDDRAVLFDASGLARVIGPPSDIAREVQQLATARGLSVHIALAGTTSTAWVLAHIGREVTVVAPGREATALEDVSLAWLETVQPAGTGRIAELVLADALSIFARWGLRTFGDLARLPRADVHARLGPLGVRCHQAVRGEPLTPFVPAGDAVRFVERLELEWPIEGLEPLSFVLARLCEALSRSLERADRGAVLLQLRLRLVTRATYARTLDLPAPLREARVLRTLIVLDLESHPPPAAIDCVELEAGVAPGAIVQGSLLRQALPTAEDLATLLARLRALAGQSRVGAPALVDTHDARTVAMFDFHVPRPRLGPRDGPPDPLPILQEFRWSVRRFRSPVPARVVVDHGAPVRVEPAARGLAGGRVVARAGPWRTSGRWWALDQTDWDRDEWEVELSDSGVYRLAKDRATRRWVIEGVVD